MKGKRTTQSAIGVIGGSGLYDIEGLNSVRRVRVRTPFGAPSDSITVGTLEGVGVAFLSRHGRGHRLNPAEINYRANIHALKSLGVTRVISVSAVGSMKESISPGHVVMPDQFIDLTKRRHQAVLPAERQLAERACRKRGRRGPARQTRVEFFMKMLTDAFSPSNFLASNPATLKELMSTRGESLVRGLENIAQDLRLGGGTLAIAQTAYEQFRIGENVATAPGKVIFRNEIIELIQYSPATEEVYEIPLVIFPPWINKFYILDPRPENSMIRWLVNQGITVFVASWVNPDQSLASKTFEDYMRLGVYEGVAKAIEQSGAPQVNTVGYCIGGTLLSCTLAHMAAKGVEPIASATFFAAQQDFSEAGELGGWEMGWHEDAHAHRVGRGPVSAPRRQHLHRVRRRFHLYRRRPGAQHDAS